MGNALWGIITPLIIPSGIASDANGNLSLTGAFSADTVAFGNMYLTNTFPVYRDVFVAKCENTTGIETLTSNNNFSIYPNPATNQLNITLTKPITKNTTLTITDMQGRVVKENPLSLGEGAGGEVIDISTLQQGIYLLKLNGQVQRFVKM